MLAKFFYLALYSLLIGCACAASLKAYSLGTETPFVDTISAVFVVVLCSTLIISTLVQGAIDYYRKSAP